MRIFITFLLATVIGATAYAVDFRLRDFNGDDFRIAQVKTELTLVFLYNSDCDACRKGAAQIEKSATVNSLTVGNARPRHFPTRGNTAATPTTS